MLDWDSWLHYGPDLRSDQPFAVLLPQPKDVCLQKALRVGTTIPELCAGSLNDPRTQDVSCTFFDHITAAGHTVEKCLVQMGVGEVRRVTGTTPATTFITKTRVKVSIELSYEEYKECGSATQWDALRRNESTFLEEKLDELLPPDAILECPKNARWNQSNTEKESISAIVVLTRKGYAILI